jgi:membrane-bound lytic murein transglycosylase B
MPLLAFLLLWALRAFAATPTEPAAIAEALVAAERGIRDPAVDDATAAQLGAQQQLLLNATYSDPLVEAAVIPLLPADLAPRIQAEIAAMQQIRRTVGGKRRSLPAWEIAPALPAATLRTHYETAATEFGIPWEILAAIHFVETRMGRLRGVSGAGAKGPMQFIPETWAIFGEGDINDSQDAIRAAARHLSHFGMGAEIGAASTSKALLHYNPSDAYARSVVAWAQLMREEPTLYRGYWGWQVYYVTVRGTIRLPEGYIQAEPVSAVAWCAEDPSRCPPDPNAPKPIDTP